MLDQIKNGIVKQFTLSLDAFNEDEEYIGRVGFTYQKNILNYTPLTNDNLDLVHTYSKNSNLTYISEQIKKIPIRKQIKASELKYYVVRYNPGTKIDKGTPIFDCRDSKEVKVLSKEDYNKGLGGISDGDTRNVIRLYDGSSIIAEEQYLYVFDEIQEDVPNNPEYMMETDYYINDNTLKFTKDYGKTWIESDLTKEQIDETLEYYKSNSLEPNSWFVSTNDLMPIAYFYGKEATLRISKDNGETWRDLKLPNQEDFYKGITERVVGFTSQNFGYVALGTDYSMGSGEMKKIYITCDGAETWNEINPPVEDYSSEALIDLYMYDKDKGVIALNNSQDINMPNIYATTNGGESWKKVDFTYFNLPDEITYITDIDKITFENGEYYIQLGQGDSGILKPIFRTRDLLNNWEFVRTKQENVHTVG